MLIQALTVHFQSYFDRAKHHNTVLWFGAEEEYAPLLDHLAERQVCFPGAIVL